MRHQPKFFGTVFLKQGIAVSGNRPLNFVPDGATPIEEATNIHFLDYFTVCEVCHLVKNHCRQRAPIETMGVMTGKDHDLRSAPGAKPPR